MCVIKGNAYGHDMLTVAKILAKEKPDYFAVFTFEDALTLRKSGVTTAILVLCPAQKEWCKVAAEKNIELSVTSVALLAYIKKTKFSKKLKIHINVETGLGRDGFSDTHIHQVLALVDQAQTFDVVGLFTHFSGAESREFDYYTKNQVEKLLSWKQAFSSVGIYPLVHASGTAGSLMAQDYQFDIVRFGLGLYGLWPSEETKHLKSALDLELRPVLSWKTKIVEIKELPKLSGVGYDATYVTKQQTTTAVLPVGYFDGLSRIASGKGTVLVAGKKVPQIGRIMMNMCVVDITGLEGATVGTEVVLIGTSEDESIFVEEVAKISRTINYEFVTRIQSDIPRVVVAKNKKKE